MPGHTPPLQRPGASAGRLAAVGVAAAVTLLTLAGQVGIGPGAAQAQMRPAAEHGAAGSTGTSSDTSSDSPSGTSSGTSPSGAPAAKSSDADSSGRTRDDDWLTIDDTPSSTADSTKLPNGTGSGKRIVYDISDQRVWLVDGDGSVVRTYPVSGGRNPDLLDPGRYRVSSMSRHATSYDHKETMQYMVRFASGDHAPIGFHDVPVHKDGTLAQGRSELGTPLSSGCIRQWITDARALWDFAEVGTHVVVTA